MTAQALALSSLNMVIILTSGAAGSAMACGALRTKPAGAFLS